MITGAIQVKLSLAPYQPGNIETKRPSHFIPDYFYQTVKGNWENNLLYLLGIQLYNHGYYWECHEALEYVWNEWGRKNKRAKLLQGFIQLAAMFLKLKKNDLKSAKLLQSSVQNKIVTEEDGLEFKNCLGWMNIKDLYSWAYGDLESFCNKNDVPVLQLEKNRQDLIQLNFDKSMI